MANPSTYPSMKHRIESMNPYGKIKIIIEEIFSDLVKYDKIGQ